MQCIIIAIPPWITLGIEKKTWNNFWAAKFHDLHKRIKEIKRWIGEAPCDVMIVVVTAQHVKEMFDIICSVFMCTLSPATESVRLQLMLLIYLNMFYLYSTRDHFLSVSADIWSKRNNILTINTIFDWITVHFEEKIIFLDCNFIYKYILGRCACL